MKLMIVQQKLYNLKKGQKKKKRTEPQGFVVLNKSLTLVSLKSQKEMGKRLVQKNIFQETMCF